MACVTVLPAVTCTFCEAPSALTVTVICSATCGERQAVSSSDNTVRNNSRCGRGMKRGMSIIIQRLLDPSGERHHAICDGDRLDANASRDRAERTGEGLCNDRTDRVVD